MGEEQEAEVPHQHRALGKGTLGLQGQPPHPIPGHMVSVQEIRGGGAHYCWDGQQAMEQPLLPAGITRKTLPSLGWGTWGTWQRLR